MISYASSTLMLMCCLPLLGRETECFPCGLHDLSCPGFILGALGAQEATQLVLFLGKNCDEVERFTNFKQIKSRWDE